MRYFTSLFMLLSIFLGTVNGQVVNNLSELSNTKVYTLKSGRGDHYLLYHPDAPNNLSSTYGSGHQMAFDKNTKNFQFAIIKYGVQYFFYNLEAQKFVGNGEGNNAAISLVEEPTNDVEIRRSLNKDFHFVLSTNRIGALNVADVPGTHGVVNWTGGYTNFQDTGNIFKIEEAGELSQDLQEKILSKITDELKVDGAKLLVSCANDTLIGSYSTQSVSAVKQALDTYNQSQTQENKSALIKAYSDFNPQTAEKVSLCEGDKFKFKSYDKSRGYLVYSAVEGNGSENHPYLAGTSSNYGYPSCDDSNVHAEWAIIECSGHKYLFNVGKKAFLKPKEASDASSTYDFEFTQDKYKAAEITIENLDCGISALKYNNRYLECSPGWGGTSGVKMTGNNLDPGSWMSIVKFEEKLDQAVQTEMETLVYNDYIPTWKTEESNILGYVGGYEKSTETELNAVSSRKDLEDFEANKSRIQLTEGYYYIKGNGSGNAQSSWYITYDDQNRSNMKAMPLPEGGTPGLPQLWKFVSCEDGYKLQSCNQNKYPMLAEAPSYSQINQDYKGGNKFIFEDRGTANILIKNGNGKVMRAEGTSQADRAYAINSWSGENNVTWHILPAEDLSFDITVSSVGYATAYLPFDVDLEEGLEAYTITSLTESKAAMTKVEDVKGHNGVILKGNAQKYSLKAKVNANANFEGNLLEGTTFDTPILGEAYILSNPEGGNGVGLYRTELNCNENMEHITDGSATHFKNNAYKAYLPKQSAANVRFYGFDFSEDGTTGIEGIHDGIQNNANAPIYDLSGRRVYNTNKGGVYIVNGKKVVR